MHRLTTRLLLLVTILGNLGPLALAATATPPHACCVRQKIHSCHDPLAPPGGQLTIRDAGCCNQECGRAFVTAQWAHKRAQEENYLALNVEHGLFGSSPNFFSIETVFSRSPRGPPSSS